MGIPIGSKCTPDLPGPDEALRLTKLLAASKTYLKFLHLAQALRAAPSSPALDPLEERLLNQLATVWDAGDRVTVLEAMAMSPDASARTVHRRLKSLQSKAMITLETDADDSRVKYVAPTRQAARYFERLGQCLQESLRR